MPELSRSLYRAGEGEPLVLLHGLTGTWQHWRPVLAELVARFEVIAPTLAGHDGGPPIHTQGPLTLATAADSLERHLDDLLVDNAHIVGNSAGGALAIELAARGRARSVVAISPGGGWPVHSGEAKRVARYFTRQQRLLRASRGQLDRVMRSAWRRRLAFRDVMYHGGLLSPTDAVALARGALGCQVVDQVVATLLDGTDAMPANLDRLAVPVLVAWGERDRILPLATCAARYRSEIADLELRVLRGAGHVPMWDQTRLVVDTIVGWADRRSSVVGAPAR